MGTAHVVTHTHNAIIVTAIDGGQRIPASQPAASARDAGNPRSIRSLRRRGLRRQ